MLARHPYPQSCFRESSVDPRLSHTHGSRDPRSTPRDPTGSPIAFTSEGHERHLATNYLGPSLLTRLLLPSLLRTARETGRTPRIVHVTSLLHHIGVISKDDPNLSRRYHHRAAYAQSKLLQVLFSWELQRRRQGKLVSVAVHPGLVATSIARGATGRVKRLLMPIRFFALPKEQGASSVRRRGDEDGMGGRVRGGCWSLGVGVEEPVLVLLGLRGSCLSLKITRRGVAVLVRGAGTTRWGGMRCRKAPSRNFEAGPVCAGEAGQTRVREGART